MKTAYVITIHSHIDVITNSSTELFVVSDGEIETVTEMLKFMLEQWNLMAAKGLFGEWYIRNERVSLKDGKAIDPKPLKEFDDVFKPVFIMTEKHVRNDGWTYQTEANIGKIIIKSESDNSIPGEIMEWIESAFSAQRYHLG